MDHQSRVVGLVKRGAPLVGEPPRLRPSYLRHINKPLPFEFHEAIPCSLWCAKTDKFLNLCRGRNGRVRLLYRLKEGLIAHRRLSASHANSRSERGFKIYPKTGNSVITSPPLSSGTPKRTNTRQVQLLANGCRIGSVSQALGTGPRARRSRQPMKSPHNRTGTDGRNVHSFKGFLAGVVPDRAEQERQLRGIVDRHPVEDDERDE